MCGKYGFSLIFLCLAWEGSTDRPYTSGLKRHKVIFSIGCDMSHL